MNKVVVKEVKTFYDCFKAVEKLVNEVQVKFDSEGMKIVSMDPANVAMVSLFMKKGFFQEYTIEKDLNVFVSMSNMIPLIKRMEKGTLSMEITEADIELRGSGKSFSVPLINGDESKVSMPKLEFKSEMMIGKDKLNDAIDDCDTVAESIEMTLGETLVFKAGERTQTKGVGNVVFDAKEVVFTMKEPARSKFSIEYLKKFLFIGDQVTMKLNTDYPLLLLSSKNDVDLMYILAPRVSD